MVHAQNFTMPFVQVFHLTAFGEQTSQYGSLTIDKEEARASIHFQLEIVWF